MNEIIGDAWNDFLARTTGPMWFRLILQPTVAVVFGVRAGLRNARRPADAESRSARALDPAYRKAMFGQAVRDVGLMFLVGVALDTVFQLMTLRAFYPLEALLVGFLLVALPYQIVRTVTARLASRS